MRLAKAVLALLLVFSFFVQPAYARHLATSPLSAQLVQFDTAAAAQDPLPRTVSFCER